MSKRLVVAAVAVLWVGASAQETVPAPPACSLPEADRAWLERALEAWRFASREISGIGHVPTFRAFFFSADCLLTSDDALTSPTAEGVTWTATPHAGSIALPDGSSRPVEVTSFASGEKELRYFVMSTPSVWEAGGVGKGPDLQRTMVSVLLHEATHVAQLGPYGDRLGALIERYSLPDSFNDNAVEDRFETNREFADAVQRETQMLLSAAMQEDETEARLGVYEARAAMRERGARWFVGEDAYFSEIEDLWLTFEGSAQWVAYQWVTHPEGGAMPRDEALRAFARGQWSQMQGFAVVLALDRLMGPGWKRHAFGDGAKTVLAMLDEALAE